MHIKIQGGGEKRYANTGSCSDLISYLEHEDFKRIISGDKPEPFFSHFDDSVSTIEIIHQIDNNRQKLCRKDAKFFVITVSFSEEEMLKLGDTENERSEKVRKYIRDGVMKDYAENFNKNLQAEDIMYFAKIHHDRERNDRELNLHAHIVVSRKTTNGKVKISPMTNHKTTQNGAVKGGFARTEFYDSAEKSFDFIFDYKRRFDDTFQFKNEMKKAKPNEVVKLVKLKLSNNYETINENSKQKLESDLVKETSTKTVSKQRIK
ncbi:MAG TPA: DUF5712 family protein [Moheibacter sp.]|nr:DUF5712 family protein [Moheibacter sp.]